MSLFGGLFNGQPADGGLFSEKSKFKASGHSEDEPHSTKNKRKEGAVKAAASTIAAAAAAAAQEPGSGKRRRAAAAAEAPTAAVPQHQHEQRQQQHERPGKKHKQAKDVESAKVVPLSTEPPAATQQPNGQQGQHVAGKKQHKAKVDTGNGRKQQQQQQQQQQKQQKQEEKKPGRQEHDKKRKKEKERSSKQAAKDAAAALAAASTVAEEPTLDSDRDGDGGGPSASSDEEDADGGGGKGAGPTTEEDKAAAAAARAAADADKLQRTVFVGNLPVATARKQLLRLFERHGAVESVRLRSVPVALDKKLPRRVAIAKGAVDAGRGGAHGYVVFEDAAAVEAALALNMSEFNGHHIMVNRAAAPRGKAAKQGERGPGGGATYDPVRSVFVGNLDFKVAEEELVAAFSQGPELQGALEAVRVVRDAKTNIGKGFAFVLFKTKAAARAALALDGTKVAKRTIRVTRATQGGGGIGKAGPKGKGGKPAAGSGGARRLLGVQQGGVAKKSAQGRPAKAAVAAASDWQGLQTKGRGTKVRGPKRSKPSGGGTGAAGGGTGPGTAPRKGPGKGPGKGAGKQKQQGKRPAVAARKAAQRQQSANSKQR